MRCRRRSLPPWAPPTPPPPRWASRSRRCLPPLSPSLSRRRHHRRRPHPPSLPFPLCPRDRNRSPHQTRRTKALVWRWKSLCLRLLEVRLCSFPSATSRARPCSRKRTNGGRRYRRSPARWGLSPATPLQPRRSSLATPHKIRLTTRESRRLLRVFAESRSSVLRAHVHWKVYWKGTRNPNRVRNIYPGCPPSARQPPLTKSLQSQTRSRSRWSWIVSEIPIGLRVSGESMGESLYL